MPIACFYMSRSLQVGTIKKTKNKPNSTAKKLPRFWQKLVIVWDFLIILSFFDSTKDLPNISNDTNIWQVFILLPVNEIRFWGITLF